MRRIIFSLLLAAVLLVPAAGPAAAQAGQPPAGVCPEGFYPHMVMHHEDHAHHVGLTVNLNGNDYICVLELNNGLHVHVEDVIPE